MKILHLVLGSDKSRSLCMLSYQLIFFIFGTYIKQHMDSQLIFIIIDIMSTLVDII